MKISKWRLAKSKKMIRKGIHYQVELKLSTPKVWPNVAIIILNWNGWQNTLECLESLQHLDYPNYSIILVDNGSTDNSVKKIKKWCNGEILVNNHLEKFFSSFKTIKYIEYSRERAEKGGSKEQEAKLKNIPINRKITIIQTGENLGYTGGNNVAINYALKKDYDYFWILNNDTVVENNSLTEIIKLAEASKRIGAVGSLILDYETCEEYFPKGKNYLLWPPITLSKKDENLRTNYRKVEWLHGASLLMKKITVQEVGMFDDNYFLYNEERDWCARARNKGWNLYCALNSKIWHKDQTGSKSKNITKYILGKRILRHSLEGFKASMHYGSRNGVYFVKKNYPIFLIPYVIFRTLHLLGQITLYDDKKLPRIWIVLIGTWEGLIAKMGKITKSHT